ncbi:hypothetical protein Dimus_013492 [Dionaea muscipula]
MVGRRRGTSPRRVREAVCDLKSPDPHCQGLTRGSPSLTAFHFWQAPPLLVCVDTTEGAYLRCPCLLKIPQSLVQQRMGRPPWRPRGRRRMRTAPIAGWHEGLSQFLQTISVPEKSGLFEGFTMASSSRSSTPSPTTVVLLCQGAMDTGGLAEGRLKLARAGSFRSVSTPSMGACLSVSDDGR